MLARTMAYGFRGSDSKSCENQEPWPVIFDRQRGRFVLMTVGWDDGERVHHPVIHIDIIGGKLWLQANNTDCDVAAELVSAHIPQRVERNRVTIMNCLMLSLCLPK